MIDLRQGDCYEIIKSIPDKSVDLVVIDFNTAKQRIQDACEQMEIET